MLWTMSEGRAIKHFWKGLRSAVDVSSYVLLCMSTSTLRGLEKEHNKKNMTYSKEKHAKLKRVGVMGYGHYNIPLILKDLCTLGF